MGNKRKASLVILVIVVAALAVFPFVAQLFGVGLNRQSDNVGAATVLGNNGSFTDSSYTVDATSSGIYMFYGAGGAGWLGGAHGISFFKAGSSYTGYRDYNGQSNGYYTSGGYTKIPSNFALPDGQTTSTNSGSFTLGGGGGEPYTDNSNYIWQNWNSRARGYFAGVAKDSNSYNGNPGNRDSSGYKGIPNDSTISAYYSKTSVKYTSGSYAQEYTVNARTGVGGAGYKNGGGGGYWTSGSKGEVYAGGGGCSSPNGYPVYASDAALGAKNDGGFVSYYRIDPVNFPTAKEGNTTTDATIVDPTSPGDGRYTPGSAISALSAYIKTGWVYSEKADSKVASDWKSASEIKNSSTATSKTIYCRYVVYAASSTYTTTNSNGKYYPAHGMRHSSAASAATDETYTIAKTSITLTKYGNASVSTKPTAKTLTYTGKSQALINAGAASNGTMYYSLSSSGSYSTSIPTATNPGTYTVYYYAKANTYYKNSGAGMVTVTIQKVDPGLSIGSLKATDVTYTRNSQKVFTGAGTITNSLLSGKTNGTIYYTTVWVNKGDSPTTPASSTVGSTSTTDCIGTNAYVGDKQQVAYLYYRIGEGTYNKAVGWTLVKDSKGNPLTNQIKQATLSLKATLMAPVNYDAKSHQIISSVQKTVSTGVSDNSFIITYYQTRIYVNGRFVLNNTSRDYATFQHTTAGRFEVYATWTGANHNYASQTTKVHLGTTYIHQINSASANIKVSGLTKKAQKDIKLDPTGKAYPYSAVTADMTVLNYAGDNGITTNNNSSGTAPDINKFAFCFSQSETAPVDGYTETTSAADLNSKLKNASVNNPGTWYLYFKVIQHMNLKTGETFRVDQFAALTPDLQRSQLAGITINRAVTFDTDSYVVASGTLYCTLPGIDLVGVKYAIGESDEFAPGAGWNDRIDQLPAKIDAGNYHIWVKWEQNEFADAGNCCYGTFTINKYNAVNEYVYFSGIDFESQWGNGTINNKYMIYTKSFNNIGYTLGAMSSPYAYVSNNNSISSNDFGSFKYAYGTASAPTSEFYSAEKFNELTIKDGGTHYFWIQWTGSQNIEAGQSVYRMNYSSQRYEVIFKINALTDANAVQLAHTNFAESVGEVPFAYELIDQGDGLYAQDKPQSLFNSAGQIALNVNGGSYLPKDFEFTYLLKQVGETVNLDTTGWATAINRATAVDVGVYNLWMKLVLDDSNVQVTKIINLNKTAEIIPADSFVAYKPTIKEGLEANTSEQQLINDSVQKIPPLEYRLADSDIWVDSASKIVGVKPGTYIVYYRGATYGNKFKAVEKDNLTDYDYLTAVINRAGVTYNPKPSAIAGVFYNAKPQVTFEAGKAEFGNRKIELLYSWEESADVYYTYDEFITNHNKTEAGKYILWFDVPADDPDVESGYPDSITVEILKANIKINTAPLTGADMTYKGADYQLMFADVDYAMVDKEDIMLEDANGNPLNYYNRLIPGYLGGTMGQIYYAVSTASDFIEKDAVWKNSWEAVTARNAGIYYLWVKVDAGDNHKAHEPTCCNLLQPIEIKAVSQKNNNCKYENLLATDTTYTTYDGLRFNGLSQNLIQNLDLRIKVANRDENGDVVDANGEYLDENATSAQVKYNEVDLSELGTVYYTLAKSAYAFPEDNDISANGWQEEWETLARIDAGTYYLLIMLDGTNFDGKIKFSLSLCISNPAEIKITPALKSDLAIAGINSEKKYFASEPQVMANGSLTVTINGCDVLAEVRQAQYGYLVVGADKNTIEWANSLDEAKVTEVDKYQLYVKLAEVTGNIDTSEDLIFQLFNEDSYAEIVLAIKDHIEIIAPVFVENLVYNGQYQNLITEDAYLKMKNGNQLIGETGAITYYISNSSLSSNANTGTTQGGQELTKETLREINAGTYFIWVKFGQGRNHAEMTPSFVGTVTIESAKDEHITLSGIKFEKQLTYDGTLQSIINGGLQQNLSDNNYLLTPEQHYTKIEYAYSNDPEVGPVSAFEWVENINDLKARNVDKYYIWVRVTGKKNDITNINNIQDYTKCYFLTEDNFAEIHRADLEHNDFDGVDDHEGLVYIAQNQVLASIPNKITIKLNGNETDLNTAEFNNDINISWALGLNEVDAPDTGWESDIQRLQGVASGKYYLWIWVKESKNFNEYMKHYTTVEIGKGTIEFTLIPSGYPDLIYQGDYQKLLNSGAVAKFSAYGNIYDANEVVIEYALDDDWNANYESIKGLNAKPYTVKYRVADTDNWYENEQTIQVTISPEDASRAYVGLIEAPAVKENLHYDETKQDLISFGILSSNLPVTGCGAALEGSRFVFYYTDKPDDKYEYYFDAETETYVWGDTGKLPGKSEVGTYTIGYYITASKTGNYKESAKFNDDLIISIAPREVRWIIDPSPIYGVKYTGTNQQIVNPGELNVGMTNPVKAKGVTVKYTMDKPSKGEQRVWSEEIPEVNGLGLFNVWYYVEVNENNVFIGENNEPATAKGFTVLIERNVLVIIDSPRPETLEYTAGEQSLVNYYYLSTTEIDAYGDKAPYIEYSFDKTNWSRIIKAKDVGEYTIYYRLVYDPTLFDFEGNDGSDCSLSVVAKIKDAEFSIGDVRAVFVIEEDRSYATYEVSTREVINSETGEVEKVPLYSAEFMREVEEKNCIEYYYRKNDVYHQNQKWSRWDNNTNKLSDTGMADYEFMMKIVIPDGADLNFGAYEQETDFYRVEYREDRKIQVVMEDYNTPAYVRVWIDFTGSMPFEESLCQQEGYIGRNSTWDGIFRWVYSNGADDKAVIRIEAISNDTFYYISPRALTLDERINMKLDKDDLVGVNKSFNTGLKDVTTTIYLYEVYHIQYNPNGGIGDNLSDGWKWHNIEYQLEENVYQKMDNGTYLEPNGWNTSKAGSGNSYNGASMTYRENASQIFYARYFGQDETRYTINWKIGNYILSRDFRVWFDATNPEYADRTTGILILKDDLITLPQVKVDEKGNSLADIFNGYVLGWYEEDGTPYTIGMTAVRDMTFVAELNSDVDDFVECKFVNADDALVHDSGKIASGAEAYMALSGMDANLIKDYQDGYDQWVEKYGYDYLDRADTTNGIITYHLGAKTVVEEETKPSGLTWADYVPMFVILGVGLSSVVICLVVYLILRKKQIKKLN